MSKTIVSFQNKTAAIEAEFTFQQMEILEGILKNAALESITSGDSASVAEGELIVSIGAKLGVDASPTASDTLNEDSDDYNPQIEA